MMREVYASKLIGANNYLRTLSGSEHLILLREFRKPEIDPDYNEAIRTDQVPSVEQVVLAKIRMVSENEMLSTEVGMTKQGDLFVQVDPDVNVTNQHEMRFNVDTVIDGVVVSSTWDYTIYDVKRSDFGDNKVYISFAARRKKEQTPGGSLP